MFMKWDILNYGGTFVCNFNSVGFWSKHKIVFPKYTEKTMWNYSSWPLIQIFPKFIINKNKCYVATTKNIQWQKYTLSGPTLF